MNQFFYLSLQQFFEMMKIIKISTKSYGISYGT